MKRLQSFYLTCLIMLTPVFVAAQETLIKELQPLEPFIGKTWKTTFATADGNGKIHDIARWERALNGKAVRILHSVNNGDYGGETIVYYDKKKESLRFFYFTTAGFFTEGSVTIKNGKMESHEFVSGNEEGISEVKSVNEILEDGTMKVTSRFLKNGEWQEKRVSIYYQAPKDEVIFK